MTTELRSITDPYIGPRPFARRHADRFFGRNAEVAALRALLYANRVVVLHAASGAGKTSMVNAGLFPALEEEGFDLLPVARVGGVDLSAEPVGQDSNPYSANVLASWPVVDTAADSLTDALAVQPRVLDDDGLPAIRLAVLDQFEELFTWYPEHWAQRRALVREVRAALESDPMLRVLFVIRDDYLGRLNPFLQELGSLSSTMFHLDRLRREAAIQAVVGPLRGSEVAYGEGVADELVDTLMRVRVQREAGTVEVPGEFAEPVQLQVVCAALWHNLPDGVTTITKDHFKTFGDVDAALGDFYNTSLEKAAAESLVAAETIHDWFKHNLITEAGTRATVFRGEKDTAGLPNGAVDKLEDLHVIRGEERRGGRWYELTHDRLVAAVEQRQPHDLVTFSADQWAKLRGRTRTAAAIALGLVLAAAAALLWIWVLKSNADEAKTTAEADAAAAAAAEAEAMQAAEDAQAGADAAVGAAANAAANAEAAAAAAADAATRAADAVAEADEVEIAAAAAEADAAAADALEAAEALEVAVATTAVPAIAADDLPLTTAQVIQVLEAEAGGVSGPLQPFDTGGHAGLEVTEKDRGVVSLSLRVEQSGRYHVWGLVDTAGSYGSNSLFLLVDRTYRVQNLEPGDSLNVRVAPGTDAEIVERLDLNETIQVVTAAGDVPVTRSVDGVDWYQVLLEGRPETGWVHSSFIGWETWDMFEKEQVNPVGFAWDQVSTRCNADDASDSHSCDPLILDLEAGTHTLTIRGREVGTKIDKIVITRAGDG